MKISVIILTKNEEKNIEACLKTVQWCDEIVVIDDHSTDATVAIAKKFGARIYSHGLENNFSAQRNFGLEKAEGDWVVFIDADERVSEKLAREIQAVVQEETSVGFYIQRLDAMWGKTLLHGESGNIRLLRLAKKDAGEWKGTVHETWDIRGNCSRLENPLRHFPHQSITEFLQEINFYTSLRAEELYRQQVSVRYWHIIAYPKAKFLQNYILKKGYLDGTAGIVFALCMSFHSFLVRGKLWQLWQKK